MVKLLQGVEKLTGLSGEELLHPRRGRSEGNSPGAG
jgi:hypothetical protein